MWYYWFLAPTLKSFKFCLLLFLAYIFCVNEFKIISAYCLVKNSNLGLKSLQNPPKYSISFVYDFKLKIFIRSDTIFFRDILKCSSAAFLKISRWFVQNEIKVAAQLLKKISSIYYSTLPFCLINLQSD